MKNLMLVLVLLVSGIGYSQDHCFCDFVRSRSTKTYEFKDQSHLMEYLRFNDSLRKNFNGVVVEDSILFLINKDRISNNLTTLVRDTILDKASELQSKYCANNSITTHDNPIEGDFQDRGRKFGLKYEVVTNMTLEIVYTKQKSPAQLVVCNFLLSKGHTYAIRDPENTKCGISVHRSPYNHNDFYTVIVFSTK